MVKKDLKKKPPRQTDVLENLQVNSSKTLQLPTARMPVSNLQAKAIKKFSPGRTQFGKRWQEVGKYATRVFLRHKKHILFRHRAAQMTRTIAFYTTFTPRHRNPPAVRRGKFSCPTSQSRFQFKCRNKKKKKNNTPVKLIRFRFIWELGENKPRWTKTKQKKKRNAGWCDGWGRGGVRNLRAMLYTPLRRVHTRIHSPWYALAKCREFPAATNFSPGTVFGQLTATRNARTASPAWVHFTFAFSARIDASTFAEDFACIFFCT